MKNVNRIFYAVLFTLLLASCSKDALQRPAPAPAEKPALGKSAYYDTTESDKYGAIRAKVLPLKYPISVRAFSDDFKSEPVYIDPDGVALLEWLPPGIYTVIAHLDPMDEGPKEREDIVQVVEVEGGKVTDISIEFE